MPFSAYGVQFPDPEAGVNPWTAAELMMAFNPSLRVASGFQGKYFHLRRAIDLIWNDPRRQYAAQHKIPYDERKNDAFIWNDFTERMMEGLCEEHYSTCIWSGNAMWKTTTVALYVLCAFYASPTDTSVVLTTTTLAGLKKRIWKEVLKFHRWSNCGIGHVSASDFAIRLNKGSDDSGIFGFATGQDEGEVQKAVDKIIGFHNRFVIAGVDEGQATNEAIIKGCLSLEAGAERFQLIVPGNPDNELDTLGQESEPIDGYSTISPETGEWKTKRGICIHLDCYDCPRVKEGDEFYPGMLRQKDIDSAIAAYGEDSPEFWRTRRGFIAPQGITKNVLTPAIIRHGNAWDKATWVGEYTMGAGLDPAFEGGDRRMLRFAKCGEMTTGKVGIELNELVRVNIDVTSNVPIHYQIVYECKRLCEAHDPPVLPQNFALDSTGEGGGLASIFMREWSAAITLIEFGGRASDLQVGEHVDKKGFEEYMNRVTELWYSFRHMVYDGLIRGLDKEAAKEFCQRLWDYRGNLKMLEPKKDMKARTRRSPDLADATVVVTEMFRQRMHLGATGQLTVQTDKAWRDYQKKNNISSEQDYLVEA
jgi:hypothetical protein